MGTLLPIPIPSADLLEPARSVLLLGPSPERDAGRAQRSWNLETLHGGLTEISGPQPAAGFTAVALLLREAQERGEPAAWIAAGDSLFHARDLHAWGLDLQALPIVRVRGAVSGARAAEHLLRSGAFGLVLLDLGEGVAVDREGIDRASHAPRIARWSRRIDSARGAGGTSRASMLPSSAQVRLAALCRRHRAALLLLARRPEGAPPVASMAVLRAEGTVQRVGFDRFRVRLRILKDKRQGVGWTYEEVLRGPDGLC